jgi:hypothetical protein
MVVKMRETPYSNENAEKIETGIYIFFGFT